MTGGQGDKVTRRSMLSKEGVTMTMFEIDEGKLILVELVPGSGLRQVSLSPQDLAQKSAEALDNAMSAIH